MAVGIVTVCFVAHFLLFPVFGLYEDDYIYTLPSFDMGFHDWWRRAWDAVAHPVQARPWDAVVAHPVQARPLNHFVRRTLFALTLRDNTLDAAYLVSWLLVSTNALLLYRLMAQRLTPAAGAVAALLYLLHPADNARQIIMHQTDIHFGALLLLSSLSLFLAGRPLFGWIIGAASLVNYESYFLPLIVAPLILFPAPVRNWKRGAVHVLLWAVIFTAVAATRYLLGEGRAADLAESPAVVIAKIARAIIIGPGTSFRLLVQRPIDALIHLTPLLTIVALVVGAISYWLIREPNDDDENATVDAHENPVWIVSGGLLGLIATYLFAFRPDSYPPILSLGRLTALHAPGALCTAIAAGAALHWVNCSCNKLVKRMTCALLAASLGLMAAFGMEIQLTEYVAHWTKQRDYWREIFAQAKDVTDGDLILVDVEGSADVIPITPGFPRFGNVNYPPRALRFFAELPSNWKQPPRVYGLWTDTPAEETRNGLLLKTPPYFGPDAQAVVRDGRFIFFRVEDGRLKRIVSPVDIRGHTMTPKPVTAVPPEMQLKPSALYRELVEPRSGLEWFTIRNSRNYPQ